MSPLFASALTGFFVFGGVGGITPDALMKTENLSEPTYPTYSVAMTGYNAVAEQTDDTPTITGSGAYTYPEIIAARSVDLADELPYGTVIAISQATTTPNCGYGYVKDYIGYRVVGDAMNPRIRNQIDILFGADDYVNAGGKYRNPANALGMCKNVKIAVIGRVDIARIPKTQVELKALIGKASLALKK